MKLYAGLGASFHPQRCANVSSMHTHAESTAMTWSARAAPRRSPSCIRFLGTAKSYHQALAFVIASSMR